MPRGMRKTPRPAGQRNKGFGQPRKAWADYKTDYRRIDGIPAHRHLVELRTGMRLPATAVVHHVDPNDKLTNEGLFVVCENAEYHNLLERRGRALRECGNAKWLRCYRCGQWDDPKNLIVNNRRKCKGVRPDREGHLDIVHQERDGICVDISEPRPIDAGVCKMSPSGRHTVGSKFDPKKQRSAHGIESRCVDCERPIRRAHLKSVRWYAIETPALTLLRAPNQEQP